MIAGTIVYVSYQTCAVVLQNLDQAAPEVQVSENYSPRMCCNVSLMVFHDLF